MIKAMYICIFAHKVDKDATNIISFEISFFIYTYPKDICITHFIVLLFIFNQ